MSRQVDLEHLISKIATICSLTRDEARADIKKLPQDYVQDLIGLMREGSLHDFMSLTKQEIYDLLVYGVPEGETTEVPPAPEEAGEPHWVKG